MHDTQSRDMAIVGAGYVAAYAVGPVWGENEIPGKWFLNFFCLLTLIIHVYEYRRKFPLTILS